jgi:hypothetical protein
MSMEFPLSQSPRTQAFQMPQAPEDEKDMFTQSFSELAYRAFQKAQPELVSNVLTFRVLDVNVEEGMGIGTFIVQHGQDIVFVPCVVSDNAIKPMDMFYSRTSDRFYPFTTEWLRESGKDNVNQLGSGVEAPKTMPTDVDIRNLVVPPTTGRYSYASDESDLAWLPFVSALRKEKVAEPHHEPQFLTMIANATPGVKLAFAKLLTRRPKLAKTYAEFYGADKIASALAIQEKVAQEHRKEVPMKQDVFIMTNATPVQQLKKELAPGEAALAYKQIRLHGFYVKDPRPSTDDIFTYAETDLHLTQPTSPGVYNVYLADGSVEKAIIIPNSKSIHRRRSDEATFPMDYYRDKRNTPKGLLLERDFLVLLSDGRYARMDDMVAEAVIDVSHAEVESFMKKLTKEAPGNNEQGVLVSTADLDIRATRPISARNVTSMGDRVVFHGDYHHTIILNRKMKGNAIIMPQDQDTVMFAGSYRWFECKKELNNADILAAPSSIYRMIEHRLEKRGSERVHVKRAGREFMVANATTPVPAMRAVEKIANRYNLSVKTAAEIVSAVGAGIPVNIWRVKRAQGESLDPNAPAPPPAPQMDPNAPQAPPPPSGLDLATGEKIQQLQGQIAALQQMVQILSEVQQRAQMIDQGGGMAAAPAAAASMMAGPGSLGGQAPMAPAPMGAPPPQQGAPQGAAPQGPPQAPPQGAEQAMGPVPPGGGVVPPGAPPGPPEPPPPPPVMAEEEPSPEMMEQQINPAFLQDAASLQDQGIFDAAAISSMAKQKGARSQIQNYLPTVERAMDNMGRMLLLFYMQEGEIKEQIGAEAYTETEQKVRDVFKGLGDAVLALNQYSDQMTPVGSRTV